MAIVSIDTSLMSVTWKDPRGFLFSIFDRVRDIGNPSGFSLAFVSGDVTNQAARNIIIFFFHDIQRTIPVHSDEASHQITNTLSILLMISLKRIGVEDWALKLLIGSSFLAMNRLTTVPSKSDGANWFKSFAFWLIHLLFNQSPKLSRELLILFLCSTWINQK